MKISISLYEFYAMGINTLLTKAPWESEARVSPYHESFVHEQQLLSLSILLLLGEEYVPASVLKTMAPRYRDQVRHSVNQAVFSRALRHHFRQIPNGAARADQMIRRMESYISITRESKNDKSDPLEAIAYTLAKRVPPQTTEQYEQYQKRVNKIFQFTEKMAHKSLGEKYTIDEM